jgi:hypothetical protein
VTKSHLTCSFCAFSYLSFALRTLKDEMLRQENEKIFISAFVQRIRKVMHEYLATENGIIEINHVIHEMESIHRKESLFAKKPALPPQVKKRKNVYEVFRKFDSDGSDSIDRSLPPPPSNFLSLSLISLLLLRHLRHSEELNVLLQQLGVVMTAEQLADLLKEINPSGSGEINFDEFYQCKISLALPCPASSLILTPD